MKYTFQIQFCILSAVSISFSADTTCFNLMNYVPPAFKYHQLELTPQFSMNGQSSKSHNNYSISEESNNRTSADDHGNNSQNPTIGVQAQHSFYGWKGRTEWEISNSLVTNGSLTHTNPNKIDSDRQDFTSNVDRSATASGNFSVSAAHYFQWPLFVGVKINPAFSGGLYNRQSISKTVGENYWYKTPDTGRYTFRNSTTKNRNYSMSCAVNVRTGAGHIDDISFAVAALNMLDIIADNEKSYKGCEYEKVASFARLIEKVRKRRAIDSRIAFVNNIDTLCTFIKKSGIADELSPRTILEIADQWNYVFYQTRMKGFSIVLSPGVYLSKTSDKNDDLSYGCFQYVPLSYTLKEDEDNDFNNCTEYDTDYYYRGERSNNFKYNAKLLVRYERPLSRYYQFSSSGQLSASVNRITKKGYLQPEVYTWEYRNSLPVVNATQSAGLGYYPNTRTSIIVSESADYEREYNYLEASNNKHDLRNLTLSINTKAIYYISPRLQFRINAAISWKDSYSFTYSYSSMTDNSSSANSSKDFNYQLNGNLTWYIF
jgi:hypothetical protein